MKGHWPARPILSLDDSIHRTHIEALTMISPLPVHSVSWSQYCCRAGGEVP